MALQAGRVPPANGPGLDDLNDDVAFEILSRLCTRDLHALRLAGSRPLAALAMSAELRGLERRIAAASLERLASVQQEAEDGLLTVMPALNSAHEAVASMTTADCAELMRMETPSPTVLRTLRVVGIMLLGPRTDTAWHSIRTNLLKPGVHLLLHRLHHYDKDHIPKDVIDSLTPHLDESTPLSHIRAESPAAAAMHEWALAMIHYHRTRHALQAVFDQYREIADDFSHLEDLEKRARRLRSAVDIFMSH